MDHFSFDAVTFARAEGAEPVFVRQLEADYAELYLEALENGPIGATERARLDQAARVVGLDPGRCRRIEEAMEKEFQGRSLAKTGEVPAAAPSRTALFVARDTVDGGGPLLPFERPTDDPQTLSLRGRVAVLEEENDRLRARIAVLEAALLASPDTATAPGDRSSRAGEGAESNPSVLLRTAAENPRDADLLHRLFRTLKRGADVDRRFCVAQVLVVRGEATDEERTFFEAGRPGVARVPARPLSREEWRESLVHAEQDALVGEILAPVAEAVLLARVATARREGTLPLLTADTLVDPGATSLLVGKAFAWSAAVLGMAAPPLHADPAAPGLFGMVLTSPLSARAGRELFAPRSPRELAFACGRHLTYYVKEHFTTMLASSVEALEDLFLAALRLGQPGLPLGAALEARVGPIADAVGPLLDDRALERLGTGYRKFVDRGGRTNLWQWLVAVDRTASQAGLLLADDLAAARAMLLLEDPIRAEDRFDALVAFAIGDRYARLRRALGLAVV